jgi:hypothetical protein
LLRQLSGFESRHLSKIQNGRHKKKSGKTHYSPQKKEKLAKLWGPATSGKFNCRVYFAIKGGATIQPKKELFVLFFEKAKNCLLTLQYYKVNFAIF